MRFQTTDRPGKRRSRRRGAALVLVLIFAVAALMLVSTMLALSDASAKVEGSRQRDAALHFVLKHGIASALTEINRKRSGLPNGDSSNYEDPTGNGFGCILVDPVDGRAGYAVWTNGTPRKLLGRFKTKVDSLATPKVLSVVAVDGEWPASTTDADTAFAEGRLRYLTAEVQIVVGKLQFDRNAISVRGNAMAGGAGGIHGNSNQVHIYGNDVPAVNISDTTAYNTFESSISGWGTISGLDPDTNTLWADGGSGPTQTAGRKTTVTNEDAGLLSQETLDEIADGIDDRVAEVLATGTEIILPTGTYGSPTDNPPRTFYINSLLDIPNAGTLTGYGTLVINKGLTVTGDLNWTGNVIVANEDGTILVDDNAGDDNDVYALVHVKGTINVDGVLAVQGMGDAEQMGIFVKGKVNVGTPTSPGAFTLLGSVNTDAPIMFDSGSQGAQVYGIMSIMGNDLNMDFDTGAKLDVTGSLAFVTPEDSTVGLDIEFRNGAQMTVTYSATNFDGALTDLGAFYDPKQNILPVSCTTYVEDASRRELLRDEHITTTSGDHGAN